MTAKETAEIKKYISHSFRKSFYQSVAVSGLPLLGIGLLYTFEDLSVVTLIIGLILIIIGGYFLNKERKNI